jgi:3-hydroxyisobutyrate dehydrogenase-like beta-hydroxyacid dehydrogenase
MTISILGLGIIGATWARNLIADGHDVRVWNRSPKPEFPNASASIETAVDGAEFVFIVVADPAAVEQVLTPALTKLGPGQMVIQCSTISPDWTKEFGARVEATGAEFLEAPFTGSKLASEAREVVYYLGGEAELIEKAAPVLKPLSKARLHIGPRGTASALKLAMNMNIAGVAAALSESLTLARAAGLSDEVYFQALELNISNSGLAALKQPKLRSSDYSPQFSIKHMGKDLRLALETAEHLGQPLPQTARLKEFYDKAIERGWGDDDFIGLVRLLQS